MNLIRAGRRYNELAGTDINRLAGLSDGIFSVGMTLLVLGLVVPTVQGHETNGALWHELVKLAPSWLVYAMSFLTLGIFWVGQSTQLSQLQRCNRTFTWLQLVFLFAVTVVPFSTGLLARYPTLRVALIEYWLNIVLLGMMLYLSLEYGLRAQLFVDRPEFKALVRGRILIAQFLYAIATALSLVFPTWVSITLIVLIQLNYVIAPRIPILHRF